jgi:NAD(P)-dependent dehydrogenase (short-subunit alcohol dehydrogenase family)
MFLNTQRTFILSWIGYRSSKAATNQIIKTLERELALRSTPSVAVALHPGTVVGTALSKDFTKEEDAGKKAGVFWPEESSAKLLDVIKRLGKDDGGRFLDWDGRDIKW